MNFLISLKKFDFLRIMCDVAVSLQLLPVFQFPSLPLHFPPCPLVNISSNDWSHDKVNYPYISFFYYTCSICITDVYRPKRIFIVVIALLMNLLIGSFRNIKGKYV